ncbi:MAG TPA: L-aspartate oxidase [Crenalkalicoccus sp.]|jgi:L-aspartate oxidase|nr:L-aspartate oxidase [Crenalkalicoccus sp.]
MSTLPPGAPVVIGGGLAGLLTALHLAESGPVVVLARAPLGTGASSAWAQGGVAAAMGADDSPHLHLRDTLAAGDGLCDPVAAERVLQAGPAAIAALIRRGVPFDRTAGGMLALGLEAAHSRRRIVHARGDGTGAEILRTLAAAARASRNITLREGVEARRLAVEDNRIHGVLAVGPGGAMLLPARRVVLATGGIGGLYVHTTNPPSAFGQGLVLAAAAGAALANLEFVQFHPTALDVGLDPLPLVSEAVRGEGATLVDETGMRFLADTPGAELAPRDVVARAVWQQLQAGHRVFLDARAALGLDFARRFPGIAAACRRVGVDPVRQPIPVVPAAHFHMGGVAVDAAGRSTVEGLWACGEVAATGLHGANRLASNSLLEAACCAGWVAESVAGTPERASRPLPVPPLPPASDPAAVRAVLSRRVGLLREAEGLRQAVLTLHHLAGAGGPAADPARVGLMLAIAALRREESRGAHARTDFPARSPAWARSLPLRWTEALAAARRILAENPPGARRA